MTVKWVDFSGARPGAAAIKNAGYKGVIRYLSADVPSTAWKRATKAEIAAYLKAGLDVLLNFEYYEGRMLEGAAAGKADGQAAMKAAKAIGYPKGATIYFSHDTSARNDAKILAYMRAAQSAMGKYYYTDIYSGIDVVHLCKSNGVARYGWQTLAWSSGRIGLCHIYQNGNKAFNGGADEDVIRHTPIGSWLETKPAKAPKPVKKPPVKPAPPKKPVAPVKKPTAPTKPNPATDEIYKVVAGDTLNKIAKKYGTTPEKIVQLNKGHYPSLTKNPNLIHVGWDLAVGPKKAPAKPVVKPAPTTYTVKSGDTLRSIANAHKITVAQLVAWNKAKHPNIANGIHIGWDLNVKAPATKPKPPAPVHKTHKVKNGDSLIKIANEYKTTPADIVNLNKAKYPSLAKNPNLILIGWDLLVN